MKGLPKQTRNKEINKQSTHMKYALLIILALGLATKSTHAAMVDYFLKIEGVDGESADSRHIGEIEISSFSWGIHQQGATNTSGGGGGGAGKATFQDLTFSARMSKASPILMLACASGKHFESVKFVAHRPGGSEEQYMRIELEDVMVSSFQSGAHGASEGESRPMESISMNYGKITFVYIEQDAKETVGVAIRPVLTQ